MDAFNWCGWHKHFVVCGQPCHPSTRHTASKECNILSAIHQNFTNTMPGKHQEDETIPITVIRHLHTMSLPHIQELCDDQKGWYSKLEKDGKTCGPEPVTGLCQSS